MLTPPRQYVGPHNSAMPWAWRDLRHAFGASLWDVADRTFATNNNTAQITAGVGELGQRLEWSTSVAHGDGIELPPLPYEIPISPCTAVLVVNTGSYTADEKALLSQADSTNDWSGGPTRLRLSNAASPQIVFINGGGIRLTTTNTLPSDTDCFIALRPVLAESDCDVTFGPIGGELVTEQTTSAVATQTLSTTEPTLVVANGVNDEAGDVKLYAFYLWDRVLSDAELVRLHADPFGPFRTSNVALLDQQAFAFPDPVQNVQATADSSSQITVTWDALAGASTYDIERDSSVVATAHSGTSYVDSGLSASTQYDYRVRGRQ